MSYRIEHDSMGEIAVASDRLWGAQTQRSLLHFPIGEVRMPREIIRALAYIKHAAATVNERLVPSRMSAERATAIREGAEAILSGALDDHFPLCVYQTGSGTQTNMNVNEVIANYAATDGKRVLHPNDDVNMSQSSNDTFPSAMHIAAVLATEEQLLPALTVLIDTMKRLEADCEGIVKCGRTHLQDATPIPFSAEISGWRTSLERSRELIRTSLMPLRALALGGTAVGTGLNAPRGFDVAIAEELSHLCGTELVTAENKYHALTSKDELVFAHGALKALACDLMKIANDVRLLASGPRCGIGEITIPENEPGSSIMPGKVNPTQCEAVTMVAVQVMANDTAVGISASQGNFELNVFMPVCAYNYLQSVRLLAGVCRTFEEHCVRGIRPRRDVMHRALHASLMTATALTPHIGYERAARAVHKAHEEGLTLREACVALGYLTEERFDELYHPEEMI